MLRNRQVALGAGLALLPWMAASVVHSQTKGGLATSKSAATLKSRTDTASHSAGLSTDVAVKAALEPLTAVLRGVEGATGVPLSRADSVPNVPVFVASPGVQTGTLLRQIRRLLSDENWQYQWANQSRGGGVYAYRLWREPVSASQRHAFAVQQVRTRLSQLLNALRAGPASWDAMAQDDPDTAMSLQQPLFQARMLFLGTLADNQLNGVLAGQPLTLNVGSLSSQQQDLVRRGIGGISASFSTDASGQTSIEFDSRRLNTGRVVIASLPAPNDPGALSISMVVYTGATNGVGPGGDVLYPAQYPELGPQRAAVATEKIANAGHGAQVVTIDANQATVNNEPPLAAYLREFARQTHLTVVGYWHSEDKSAQRRLTHAIIDRPASEALDTLARAYDCTWLQEGHVIRFRAKQPVASPQPKTS